MKIGLMNRLSKIVRRHALFDLTLWDIDLPIRDTLQDVQMGAALRTRRRDATRVAPTRRTLPVNQQRISAS